MDEDNSFMLDNRSVEWQLEQFNRYIQLIPLGCDSNANWKQVFSAQGLSQQELIRLYQDISLARGDLVPQQAFLLAFFHLLETPHRLFNAYPIRHRQSYYRELLQMHEQPAHPDSTVVAVHLEDNVRELLIDAGTALNGGQGQKGETLLYRTEKTLMANTGQIAWCGDYWPEVEVPRARVIYPSPEGGWPEGGIRLFTINQSESTLPVYGGCSVASAALRGISGRRTIRVIFGVEQPEPDEKESLQADISSEQGWLPLSVAIVDNKWTFTLDETAPATAPPAGLDNYWDKVPVLRLRRAGGKALTVTEIVMTIDGATDIAMSTDDGQASPLEGCYPFGVHGTLGRGINLMAPEWTASEWAEEGLTIEVSITPRWLDLPNKSFSHWYMNYPNKPNNNNEFTVQPKYCNRYAKPALLGEEIPLFQSNVSETGSPTGEMLVVDLAEGVVAVPPATDAEKTQAWESWLRLELISRDFLHAEYQTLLQQETIPNPLNPPYTPSIGDLAIVSTITDSMPVQYRLTPFGYLVDAADDTEAADFPQLLLGMRGVLPGQSLSLYWKLWGNQSHNLMWQYLAEDGRWHSLDSKVRDETEGLFGSNLWQVTLPQDIARGKTRMPPELYWLRALFPTTQTGETQSFRYPRLWRVMSNAVRVWLDNSQPVSNSHFEQPLQAGSITSPQISIPGVASIEQPWPSEGGVASEDETHFFRRVAQRLRHRQRAITRNDVIDLLTEAFAEIYRVLQVNSDAQAYSTKFLVIPQNGREDNDDSLRPIFSLARLQRMTAYLNERASLWGDIVLMNPEYVDVYIDWEVNFQRDITPSYGNAQLWQALQEHYMPWLRLQQAVVQPGNQLDYFEILAFIQRHSWVENVVTLQLGRTEDSMSDNPIDMPRLYPNQVGILVHGLPVKSQEGVV